MILWWNSLFVCPCSSFILLQTYHQNATLHSDEFLPGACAGERCSGTGNLTGHTLLVTSPHVAHTWSYAIWLSNSDISHLMHIYPTWCTAPQGSTIWIYLCKCWAIQCGHAASWSTWGFKWGETGPQQLQMNVGIVWAGPSDKFVLMPIAIHIMEVLPSLKYDAYIGGTNERPP